MATYKVIQDVEAEDKLIGPLSLRQFVYAGVAAIMLYLSYFVATHGLIFMVVMFLPVAVVFGFFAFPWGRDQPTEIWALAKIRFLMKPRKRIWDQSGVKELVTITAPKHLAAITGNGLSQTEVKSRLHALADTIDSRGWVVKNSTINVAAPALVMQQPVVSDRLLDVSSFPQPAAPVDIQAADDMMDERNNPRARQMESLITASAKAHREKLMQEVQSSPGPGQAPVAPANNYWFLNSQPAAQQATVPAGTVTFGTQVVAPGGQASAGPIAQAADNPVDEVALMQELDTHKQHAPGRTSFGHMHTLQPSAPPAKTPAKPLMPPVTPAKQAAILQLASNDDLNVATIAREAKRTESPDEVVIKLH